MSKTGDSIKFGLMDESRPKDKTIATLEELEELLHLHAKRGAYYVPSVHGDLLDIERDFAPIELGRKISDRQKRILTAKYSKMFARAYESEESRRALAVSMVSKPITMGLTIIFGTPLALFTLCSGGFIGVYTFLSLFLVLILLDLVFDIALRSNKIDDVDKRLKSLMVSYDDLMCQDSTQDMELQRQIEEAYEFKVNIR